MNPTKIERGKDFVILEITPTKSVMELFFLLVTGLLGLIATIFWFGILYYIFSWGASVSMVLLLIVFLVVLMQALRSWLRQAFGKEVFVFDKAEVSHYWLLPFYKDKQEHHPFSRLEVVYSKTKQGRKPESDEDLMDDLLIKKEEVALGLILDGNTLASWLLLPLEKVEELHNEINDMHYQA